LTSHVACWVEMVEGLQLDAGFERLIAAELARNPDAEDSLEAVFNRTELRLVYSVAWDNREELFEAVGVRLLELGWDLSDVHPYIARVDATCNSSTEVVVHGPKELLDAMKASLSNGEPVACGETARCETLEQTFERTAGLASRFRAAQVEIAGDYYVAGDVPIHNENSFDGFRSFPGLFNHLTLASPVSAPGSPSTSTAGYNAKWRPMDLSLDRWSSTCGSSHALQTPNSPREQMHVVAVNLAEAVRSADPNELAAAIETAKGSRPIQREALRIAGVEYTRIVAQLQLAKAVRAGARTAASVATLSAALDAAKRNGVVEAGIRWAEAELEQKPP